MAQSKTTNRPILIAHLADLHLRDTQYATSRRSLDFFSAARRAIEVACKEADVLVIAGDIFDRPRPSPAIIGQLIELDSILRRHGKTAFTITGNHDWGSPTWLSTLFVDRLVDKTATPGIVPLDAASAVFEGYQFTGLVPHTAASFREETAAITVETRAADVVLFHGFVNGVAAEVPPIANPLGVEECPISKNNKAWLLGDIHTQGFVKLPRPGGGTCLFGYPGSLEMCSASESIDKSLPIIRLTDEGAEVVKTVPLSIRPFIKMEVYNEQDLDTLISKVTPVADAHPVVVVQFDRKLPNTIGRLHAILDAQRAVIRCYPLPQAKNVTARVAAEAGTLGMEHFLALRFTDNAALGAIAQDLLKRGDGSADTIITEMIENWEKDTAVRES